MNMYDCPKFERCNANICPLDEDWRLRVHEGRDRVCHYLIESVKPDAEANFTTNCLGLLYSQVVGVRGDIIGKHSVIKNRLKKSALTGSRMMRAKMQFTKGEV